DVIIPSVYTFYPDYNADGSPRLIERDRWVRYATTNLLEARRFGKPVIAYVWPAYHGGGGSDDPASPDYRYWKNQPIGGEFWQLILDTTRNYSDGIAIWSASETSTDGDPAWWQVTQQFMRDQGPARAIGETTVAGEILTGDYLNTRSRDLATVRITINPTNDPPTVRNDAILIPGDTSVILDVLADNGNGVDTDIDGTIDLASITVISDVANGHLQALGEGKFSYTPLAGFQGTDRFLYQLRDNEGLSSATATFAIAVNSNPVAAADQVTTNEDTEVTFSALTDNGGGADSDVDGNLDLASHEIVQAPQHGIVEKRANGQFTYTPSLDFHGVDTFTYTVADTLGAVSAPATVTITVNDVNDAPQAVGDAYQLQEDVSSTLDVLNASTGGADFDPDGTLRYDSLIITAPPAHGSAIPNPDGTVTYLPAANYHGADAFEYQIRDDDDQLSEPATVTLEILAVNDAPQAYDDLVMVIPEQAIEIDVLASNGKPADLDVDSALEAVRYVESKPPQFGQLEQTGFGTFRYTPQPGFRGIDRFRYVLYDSDGAASRTATVTLMVNVAPVAQDDRITLIEDVPAVFSILADNGHGADFDYEKALRPVSLIVVQPPAVGELINLRDGRVRYSPPSEFSGDVTFTYRIADNYLVYSNDATVTIHVSDVNDLPIVEDDIVEVRKGQTLVIAPTEDNGMGRDRDVDGTIDLATIRMSSYPEHGELQPNDDGTFTYTPTADYVGSDFFGYRVADDLGGLSRIGKVAIEVIEGNVSPLVRDDFFALEEDETRTLDVLADHGNGPDRDVDGQLDLASLQVTDLPQHGEVTATTDGQFIYVPDADYFGTDAFSYTIRDNEGAISRVAIVSLTITPINDAPRLRDDHILLAEDSEVTFTVTDDNGNGPDFDIDGNLVLDSISIVATPQHGHLEAMENATFHYTPDPDFFGIDTFQYRMSDSLGAESDAATVTIEVSPRPDQPRAFDDLLQTDEDTTLTVNLSLDH
ncbi:MAG: tandem-95 repeat protein, partial [Planctomycetales bacterium]|nr:tandem-95 repeat protein [Planctomycetales bacterium]